MTNRINKGVLAAAAVTALTIATPALAEDAKVTETTYIFNSLSFLIHGFMVMLMAAGFAMLEAGMVRTKNVATMCVKNIALYSTAGILFYAVGYNLMYMDVDGGFIGSFVPWGVDDSAMAIGDFSAGYSSASDWFFQMVFVATAASIVSGTVAERIKLWPFIAFVVVLTGFIYPIQGSWQWGGGWLAELGFSDFAGSTLVHSVGGWAALTGAIILGPRKGKYTKTGGVYPMPGSSLPLATLGTFILWFGWFGFNGGSQLALGSAADAAAIANIYINTNIAAAGGVMAAMILTQLIYKKVDLTMALNGALAGLVSITAGPDSPTLLSALLIGGVGGVIVVFAIPLLDRFKIDDVVGAIPVHLLAGIWGTMAVPITNGDASFVNQAIGVVSIGAFVIVTSTIAWFVLKATVGIRLDEEAEVLGADRTELGLEAYPEFGQGSQTV
jgi:ammonium transporter, Amt family